MKKIAILLVAALCFAGCGYNAVTLLPPHIQSVYVENFVNKIDITEEISHKDRYRTYRPGLENKVTRALVNSFILEGTLMVTDREYADAIVSGELIDYTRDPIRYDKNDEVKEYRLTIIVNFHFVDVKTGKTLIQADNFAGDATYITSGPYATDEDTAIDKATDDLTRRIVERVIEVW